MAEGRKLDDRFRVRHRRLVPAVHPLAVHEGPGANLGPPSFHSAAPTYSSRPGYANSWQLSDED